jgi:RNA polymerase sigma-70 factor (ECF subfamily)
MANRGTRTVERRPADGSGSPSPTGAGDRPPPEHPVVSAFNAMRDELLSTLVYVLGNRDDALDAAQEAFLKCWRHRDETGGVQNLRAWIFRVGLNTAKDLQRSAWNRKVKPMVTEEIMLAARDPAPGTALEDQEAVERLRQAIVALRPDEKEVFLLRQNGDLTYEQIAEIRNAPVGTVKTQMRTALIKLRRVLNPADEPAELPDA